ncbi:heavy-metal-associated domain-containing protein [Clostridium grantii]|uniref:Copper chaperone CopZ n=1 Tax=Clostridium grantii DSM 8605 TaxID=1121316 RepID=A0A1M5XR21_9CLOT|nr:heavy metal-associated domain-containing protein [Clostridium grantii]SHI01988.1 Copper chaperone CopZ [Clostridium grantii DSM 8605]
MEKIHYEVSGIINSDRKTKIKNSLDKIGGVQKVEVDVARGTVDVNFNTPATSEVIEQSIEKQGCIILN